MNYLLGHKNRLLVNAASQVVVPESFGAEILASGEEVEVISLGTDLSLLMLKEIPRTFTSLSLREYLAGLDETEYFQLSRAQQLLNWRAQHHYCGVCRSTLQLDADEIALHCENCEARLYPRISPCIIVLIEDGDRILLAHNTRFTENRFSTLAGFVDAGETAEQAVVREIKEEVGVDVGSLRYFKSQPWPFPDSLMLGFFADYVGGEIVPDGIEISEARWFTRQDLDSVTLPPTFAISRQLIDNWLYRSSPVID